MTFALPCRKRGVAEGGFDLDVKGNTDLKEAVIASTASPDKNRLSTGTLSWGDMENQSDYSATSLGVSGGFTFEPKVEDKNSGPTSGRNTGGVSPMIPQHESGSQRGVAQSGVAAGTIVINDEGNQKQDVATLNRETSNTNTTVGKNPDLANVLGKQADMMAAAQAAGEAVAKTVGDIAGSKERAALAKAKEASDAGNQELAQQYRDEAAQWEEGGANRAALHAAGGALIVGLGGGNAVAGAAGAGAASLAGKTLNELSQTIASSVGSGNADLNDAIGNLVSNVAAGGIGLAVGGGSGAATAANVDRFNRQLHPKEQTWIKGNAKRFAQQQGISEADAEQRLAQQGFRQVQAGVDGQEDAVARAFLKQAYGMLPTDGASGPGYMFFATDTQKADASMYAKHLPQDRINNFYRGNGLFQPSSAQVDAAVARERNIDNRIGGAVIAAPVIATLGIGAPLAVSGAGIGTFASIGATAGGGMDAAGQYALGGTIRPVQSIFAAASGAVAGPIGAQVGLINNVLLGGVGGGLNTTFNNVYYGESSNVAYASAISGLAGGAGYLAGAALTQGVAQVARPIVFPRPINPTVPAVLQGVRNPLPGLAGAAGGAVVQGGASFIPGHENKSGNN
ncbi:hypothetical protein Cmtc_35090 [Cupriavidus sp. TKC]|uniref:hypothetical protein n=2 Tax=Cupriavidus TaxID=106589 RepID=UPI0025A811E4|nr:hypothetical protein Cmtc_35090 [Cupriavidus sp. TKC]